MRHSRGQVRRVERAAPKVQQSEEPRIAKAKLPRALQRSEHDEQRELFAWVLLLPFSHPAKLAFAVPNGARTSISVAKRLKAEGLRAGVPDVVLPVARGGHHGLFIELKRADGVPSDVNVVQRQWHEALKAQGYRVVVAFGAAQARQAITDYLNLKTP